MLNYTVPFCVLIWSTFSFSGTLVSLPNLISPLQYSNHHSNVFIWHFYHTGSGALKALHPGLQSVISVASTGRADISVIPGQVLAFGTRTLTVLATPGHTEVHMY